MWSIMDKRYDSFSVLESPELETCVSKLSSGAIEVYESDHSSRGGNKTARDNEFIAISRHLISALYSATHTRSKEKLWVSFPAASGNYAIPLATDASVDTKKIPYSYRRFCDVRDYLVKLEWIKVEPEITKRRHRLMYPTGDLLYALKRIDLKWLKITPRIPELLVELGDVKRDSNGNPIRNKKFKTKKVLLPVINTPVVEAYRSRLFDQNTVYTEHCISLSLNDVQLQELETAMAAKGVEHRYLDFAQVQMTRIFARGKMNKGGRFYQPWWQNIPSAYRKYILIDGESTVECDYSSMALSQIYAKMGVSSDGVKDLYDLGLPNWLGRADERRDIIKKFIISLLNDEDGIYRLKKSKSLIIGLDHDALLDLLYSKHPNLIPHVEEKIGLKLHFEDSSIADSILSFCSSRGIVVLPVHDSFLVIKRHEDELIQIMTRAFQGQYSSSNPVGIDVDQGVDQLLEPESILGKYLQSWQSRKTCVE
jgi:hypothetical protein